MRMAARETVPQIAGRDCSKTAVEEGQYVRFWWRGVPCSQALVVVTRCWCHHEGVSCFSRYEEMQGLGSWNQFLKMSNCLKTCSTSVPGAQMPHSPSWIPPGGCWRSAAAVTQGSISAESDRNTLGIVAQSLANALGKCQFVVDRDDEKSSKTDWTVETYRLKKNKMHREDIVMGQSSGLLWT